MAVKNSAKRNFIRTVYGFGTNEAGRKAYLDGLAADSAKELAAGKTLIASSSDRIAVQYEQFDGGGDPDPIQELVDWAYDIISYSTAEEALGTLPRWGVKTLHTSFSGIRA